MKISKAYGYIPHELLITKSKSHCVDNSSLHLLLHYVTHQKQMTQTSCSWSNIDADVPLQAILL